MTVGQITTSKGLEGVPWPCLGHHHPCPYDMHPFCLAQLKFRHGLKRHSSLQGAIPILLIPPPPHHCPNCFNYQEASIYTHSYGSVWFCGDSRPQYTTYPRSWATHSALTPQRQRQPLPLAVVAVLSDQVVPPLGTVILPHPIVSMPVKQQQRPMSMHLTTANANLKKSPLTIFSTENYMVASSSRPSDVRFILCSCFTTTTDPMTTHLCWRKRTDTSGELCPMSASIGIVDH